MDAHTKTDRDGPEDRRRRAVQQAFKGILLQADPKHLRGIVRRLVCSDMPGAGPDAYCRPGECEIQINKHGAASVRTKAGLLGLKPAEFEWLTPLGKVGDMIQNADEQTGCSGRIVAVQLLDMGLYLGWCFAVALEVPSC
jgi:hypothetical protein